MRGEMVAMLFGALFWGHMQAQQSSANSNQPITLANAALEASSSASIPAEAPVISIKGVCNGSNGAMSSSSDCDSVITRSEFESLVQFIQPNWSMAQRRQFASSYAEALVLAAQAQKMGLDSGPRFETLMKMQKKFVLQYLLAQALAEKAAQVPDTDVEVYYQENKAAFEQIELQRLYVPIAQQVLTSGVNSAELEKRRQNSMLGMKKTADELHRRAVKGEDLAGLQTDAYKAAGYSSTGDQPKAEIEKRRPRDMPAAQKSLMDLPPGTISQMFEESNGHFIYKVMSKRTLPMEEVRAEIVQKLHAERLQQYQRDAHEGKSATLNETYFRAAQGSGNIGDEP
jgi:hypothetical protein